MSEDLLRRVAPLLGRLLEEPGNDWPDLVSRAARTLAEDAHPAVDLLRRFESHLGWRSLDERRELHTGTFDLSPVCVPYASVHLFGEESFKRANLMGGLADAYRRAGFDPGKELPDHVATILRFLPRMTEEEQRDLARFVLQPSIDRMAQSLFGSRNPYGYLLDALRGVLAAVVQAETVHV